MTFHKITEFYTEWFSVYHNITSKFRTIAIFKTASNKRMIQIKLIGMFIISYYTKVHLSKFNGSWVVSTKHTMNYNIQTAATIVFFVFDKNGLIKSSSSFEDLSVYKISWSHVDWCKFCIHLPTEFHKNLPIGSRVIRGDTQKDRQDGDLISLTFLFKESRLKTTMTMDKVQRTDTSNSAPPSKTFKR
jgi:hypothetical protein